MASSSQAKRGEEVMRFFKIIFQSTIRDKKLMIPRKFISEFGQQLLGCAAATLEVPSGDKWEVGLETDRKGFVWFCNHGWERFTEFYSLEYGHFLLFEYKGHSAFSVVICDISAVEIAYPTLSRAVEEDSLSQEILDDVDTAANEREEEGKSPMVDDSAGNVSKAATMMNEEKEGKKSLDDASENPFVSGHPFFKIKIKPSHLSARQQRRIPSSFTKKHTFIRDVEQVKLEVGDKVWSVRVCPVSNKYVMIAAGWISFVKDNSLKLGDVCVFKLITTPPDVRMQVTIIRRV